MFRTCRGDGARWDLRKPDLQCPICPHTIAARGLPPDWTEEELRRQGHDLDATQESSSEEEEDESSSEEEGENPRTGVPSALLADIEHSMSHEALLQLPIG